MHYCYYYYCYISVIQHFGHPSTDTSKQASTASNVYTNCPERSHRLFNGHISPFKPCPPEYDV